MQVFVVLAGTAALPDARQEHVRCGSAEALRFPMLAA
jgi:hypothetical protein